MLPLFSFVHTWCWFNKDTLCSRRFLPNNSIILKKCTIRTSSSIVDSAFVEGKEKKPKKLATLSRQPWLVAAVICIHRFLDRFGIASLFFPFFFCFFTEQRWTTKQNGFDLFDSAWYRITIGPYHWFGRINRLSGLSDSIAWEAAVVVEKNQRVHRSSRHFQENTTAIAKTNRGRSLVFQKSFTRVPFDFDGRPFWSFTNASNPLFFALFLFCCCWCCFFLFSTRRPHLLGHGSSTAHPLYPRSKH